MRSFVWEDMVDGAEADHDESESSPGTVEPVGAVDDEPNATVEALVAGVVDTQPDRREYPGPVLADRLGDPYYPAFIAVRSGGAGA